MCYRFLKGGARVARVGRVVEKIMRNKPGVGNVFYFMQRFQHGYRKRNISAVEMGEKMPDGEGVCFLIFSHKVRASRTPERQEAWLCVAAYKGNTPRREGQGGASAGRALSGFVLPLS